MHKPRVYKQIKKAAFEHKGMNYDFSSLTKQVFAVGRNITKR